MSSKLELLQSVLRNQGYRADRSQDPNTIWFTRDGVRYCLDADDADPDFFALRAGFEVPSDAACPETQLALAHDLGVALKGVKIFSAADGRTIVFNVESFVPEPTAGVLATVLVRALRALDVAFFELGAVLSLATASSSCYAGQA
ncbi:MAG: hypothetical protein IT379_42150 [Deltaproteobacteria bacterium]|nr:hypothetical protein [Deltaproteobacteria bacterium]